MASLTSHNETPKWDHGLRVTLGGQPKQHCAKEEKSEAANISGWKWSAVGLAFLSCTADSQARSVEGSFPSLCFYILSVWL